MAETVRIEVPLDVVDGWPPVSAETLWAQRTESGAIVIDGIPVFALDLAIGDTVEASPGPDGVLVFERRVHQGGHATYRFISFEGAESVEPVVRRLEQLGAVAVPSSFMSLWAVDVPPEASVETIHAALAEAAARGILEFEDPRTP